MVKNIHFPVGQPVRPSSASSAPKQSHLMALVDTTPKVHLSNENTHFSSQYWPWRQKLPTTDKPDFSGYMKRSPFLCANRIKNSLKQDYRDFSP